MALRQGRNNGAKEFNQARRDGIFAAPPSNIAIGKPANAGLGPAARVAPKPGVLGGNYPTMADTPANRTPDELKASQRAAYEQTWQHIANDYDANCGMASREEFAAELLSAVFSDLLEVELVLDGGWPGKQVAEESVGAFLHLCDGFNAAVHTYLAAIGVHRLHNNSKPIIRTGDLLTKHDHDWLAVIDGPEVTRAQSENHGSESIAGADQHAFTKSPHEDQPEKGVDQQKAPIRSLPQSLQSAGDVQALISSTAAKMGDAKSFRERTTRPDDTPAPWDAAEPAVTRDPVTLEAQTGIDPVAEMHEALEFVVTHWSNVDAHRLPGSGFKVYCAPGKPSDAQIPESQLGPYIVWKHDRMANRMVVGMRDLKTGEMCYVATKKDVSEYMAKAGAAVKAGVPPFSASSTTRQTGAKLTPSPLPTSAA